LLQNSDFWAFFLQSDDFWAFSLQNNALQPFFFKILVSCFKTMIFANFSSKPLLFYG